MPSSHSSLRSRTLLTILLALNCVISVVSLVIDGLGAGHLSRAGAGSAVTLVVTLACLVSHLRSGRPAPDAGTGAH